MQESEGDFDGLDEYNALVFRVFGDGRKYIANIRTDNWITGGTSHDVWQAFLFARCCSEILSCKLYSPTHLMSGWPSCLPVAVLM